MCHKLCGYKKLDGDDWLRIERLREGPRELYDNAKLGMEKRKIKKDK